MKIKKNRRPPFRSWRSSLPVGTSVVTRHTLLTPFITTASVNTVKQNNILLFDIVVRNVYQTLYNDIVYVFIISLAYRTAFSRCG